VTDALAYNPALCERVIVLGRQGRSRAEIAAEAGVSLERLAAWAAAQPDFAWALERAATECRAWWDGLAREAVTEGAVFHPAVWSKAMVQRFGSGSHRTAPDESKPETTSEPPPPRVRFDIPPNGREARRRGP